MTSPATRDPDRPPSRSTSPSLVRSVRYVGLGVPDARASAGFYEHVWGLVRDSESDGVVHFTAAGSGVPCMLRLRQSDSPRVDVVSLAVDSRADVDEVAAAVASAGAPLVSEPGPLAMPGDGYGFRFFDPDGRTIEVAAEVAPREFPPGESSEVGPAAPQALSHVVLNTPELDRATRFFVEVLGFRVSDYLEDFMVFLRCGQAHHAIALARAPHVSLNHVAYEMSDIDQYMYATGRTIRAGYDLAWGPGRHGPGDNAFSYFEDPSRFVCEYTTGLTLIVDEEAHRPSVFRSLPEESDRWGTAGPRRPEPFVGVPDCGLFVAPPL